MLEIDLPTTENIIVGFIGDAVSKNNYKNGIVGVSGGLDSAVVLALAQKALGRKNCLALLMPYKLSSESSIKHGRLICEKFGVEYEIIDITPSIDAYFSNYPTTDKILIGNKCARERMSILYDFSYRKEALVIGTSNKSELLIGYSTIYGDSAAAFLPIGDLYKTQVIALAKYLEIPDVITKKEPSADLWPNQSDEGEIGISYQKLDEILYQLIDLRMDNKELENEGYNKMIIEKIKAMIIRSQYKRTMPPIAKLQNRTIGMDFRYLRDWLK